jgi:hypothetical protein
MLVVFSTALRFSKCFSRMLNCYQGGAKNFLSSCLLLFRSSSSSKTARPIKPEFFYFSLSKTKSSTKKSFWPPSYVCPPTVQKEEDFLLVCPSIVMLSRSTFLVRSTRMSFSSFPFSPVLSHCDIPNETLFYLYTHN